ncbi:MAG TPA: Na+/H+ antiporter NhaA [Gammaproteobacteria bacterium]
MTDRTAGANGVARVLKPLEAFFRIESSSGLVLLAATLCALLWANSPWHASYDSIWQTEPTRFVINDGLMTVFFLVVGLEIRRELQDGALSTLRTAALPLVAALGGIIVPAAIYLLLNPNVETRHGWAIPTATDIAFAVGALALLGKRIAPALRALLLALAIADDVVAILVIAFFYADGAVGLRGLLLSALAATAFVVLRRYAVRGTLPYLALGAMLWAGLFMAGLHPVLAGVVTGLLMPRDPANALEDLLHAWVAYGVMPLFALANAGITFAGLELQNGPSMLLVAGIVLGLLLGKPLGIVTATSLAVQLGWCKLPQGVTWHGIALIGCLGGIGFTMSIFVATLAFEDPKLLAAAKMAVLAASVSAGTTALFVGRRLN